ncbi:MAG: DegV family protein [Chloroflexota bacterium]|nr:DegV family protein [Chloroflexota bacterium]
MQKIAIVADTSTDIPQQLAEELDIFLASLHVIIQGKDYRDKVDISSTEFYRLLPQCNPLPKTSGAGVNDFLEAYRGALAKAESVLCLVLSAQISMSLNSAHIARDMMSDADITVIDTQTCVASEALIAIAAARAAKEGQSKKEVMALVEALIPQVDTLLTMDTLEYLRKGGRLSAPQALIGRILGFRPIIRIGDDKITPVGRARSRRASIARVLDIMESKVGDREICAAILHALVPEETEVLRQEVAERFNCREIHVLDDLGPTAGAHAGPGALGVGYYPVP